MVAATIYSESFWSRVWASEDRRALRNGALLGCGTLVVAIFLLGFGGWLACWAGLVDDTTDPNLYLLQVIRGHTSFYRLHRLAGVYAVDSPPPENSDTMKAYKACPFSQRSSSGVLSL